jgi:hypothetical protein
MPDTTLPVLLSHTSDFGDRPARGNSYIEAAFRALDRADVVVTDMSLLAATECSPKQVSEGLAEDGGTACPCARPNYETKINCFEMIVAVNFLNVELLPKQ